MLAIAWTNLLSSAVSWSLYLYQESTSRPKTLNFLAQKTALFCKNRLARNSPHAEEPLWEVELGRRRDAIHYAWPGRH